MEANDSGILEQNEQFLKKAYNRALIPCMLSILSGNINILADGILVGQKVGADGLAAVNLCLPVYLVLCIAGSFLVSGTAIQASKAIGDGRMDTAQSLYQTAISSCLLASLVLTAAGLLLLDPLTNFLCPVPEIRKTVADYAGVTLAGAAGKILIYVPFWFLRMDGRGRIVTIMMTIMGVGNVLLDILFLYAFDLGVFGAGLASVIATAAACAVGFCCLCDRKSNFHFGISMIRHKKEWMEIAMAGSPSAMNNLFQTLRVLVINTLLLKYGGSIMVASFTAVNCISAFAGCITDGVPQAASPMLGIYYGEHDSSSARLLIKREWKSGLLYTVIFSAMVLISADWIAALYGLSVSLRFPLVCLCAGTVPALWSCILSGWYNVSDKTLWSNVIIFLRVFLTAAGSLFLLFFFHGNPWWFLFISEAATLLIWYVATGIYHKFNQNPTRFLLMDCILEREGRVLNFSTTDSAQEICEASSKITGFCEENGMLPRQVMRISLAIEEIMTLIAAVNENEPLSFDVRVFSLQGVIGIRFRYDGIDFNPFQDRKQDEEEFYMGIQMIESLTEEVIYRRVFGMNTLQILI